MCVFDTHMYYLPSPYFKMDDLNVSFSALVILGLMFYFRDGLPYVH